MTCSLKKMTESVHPRACGERLLRNALSHCFAGSSPRLRGTVPNVTGKADYTRFIPAPAGNGEDGGALPSVTTVHPRACGERGVIAAGQLGDGGSSPRLRGTARTP